MIYTCLKKHKHALRIQVCPKKGINPTILLWGWDWKHQTYSREGYGSLGMNNIQIICRECKKQRHNKTKKNNTKNTQSNKSIKSIKQRNKESNANKHPQTVNPQTVCKCTFTKTHSLLFSHPLQFNSLGIPKTSMSPQVFHLHKILLHVQRHQPSAHGWPPVVDFLEHSHDGSMGRKFNVVHLKMAPCNRRFRTWKPSFLGSMLSLGRVHECLSFLMVNVGQYVSTMNLSWD